MQRSTAAAPGVGEPPDSVAQHGRGSVSPPVKGVPEAEGLGVAWRAARPLSAPPMLQGWVGTPENGVRSLLCVCHRSPR